MANTPLSATEAGAERAQGQAVQQMPPAAPDLDLLFPWSEERSPMRWRVSLCISAALHVTLFLLGIRLESLIPREHAPRRVAARAVTRLYIPPDLLTQRDRNRGKISKTFDLAELLAQQQAQRKITAPAPGSVRRLELPKEKEKAPEKQAVPEISAEPPRQIVANEPPAAGDANSVIGKLPPAPVPPDVATPSAGIREPEAQQAHKLAPPKNSVQDVLQQMAKRNGSGTKLEVSDEGSPQGLPSTPGQQATQGQMKSAIELQTDPQGADFKPYLAKILAIVRRNWFSVLPSSARMGVLRGRTTIQFVVNQDGSIPKLVISDSSGLQPLDRAAVAGLSMSNPLPPLPPDFKGGFIRLQFSFNYNMPNL